MSEGDPFDDIGKLVLRPEMLEMRVHTPAKILKRRQNFILVPMVWWERLARCGSAHAYHVALFLLHLHWRKNYDPLTRRFSDHPFKLPNGMLEYDGVSRQSKWNVLGILEQRGLITIERRPRKSPIIRVLSTV
jgi:hypothetical protein